MNYRPDDEHISALLPLIQGCSGQSAVAALNSIYEYIATHGCEAVNTIAYLFACPDERTANAPPGFSLSSGYILKSITRKVHTERAERQKAIVEAHDIGNVGDPSVGRDLLSQMIHVLNSQYAQCDALHAALENNKVLQFYLFQGLTQTSNLAQVSPIQKCAASLIAEMVRLDGMHCFAPGQVIQDVLQSIHQSIRSKKTNATAPLVENTRLAQALQSQSIVILLCSKVVQMSRQLGVQRSDQPTVAFESVMKEVAAVIPDISLDAQVLQLFYAPTGSVPGLPLTSLVGFVYLLVTLLEETPLEILCANKSLYGNPPDQNIANVLLETLLTVVQVSRIPQAQRGGVTDPTAFSLAELAMKGLILVLNARNIRQEEIQAVLRKHAEKKSSLDEQLFVVETQRNWCLDDALHCVSAAAFLSAAYVDTITQTLIEFIVECFSSESNAAINDSLRLAIEKNICSLFIEILSHAASESCSTLFLSQLSSICMFMKQKVERMLTVPETHGLYAYSSVGTITTQNTTRSTCFDVDGILSIGSLALDFFLLLLETQIGSNVLNTLLPDIIPLLMVLLIFTKDELFQQYEPASDDHRIADQPSDVKRQAVIRRETHGTTEEIVSEQHKISEENPVDDEEDESEVEQWSIRMSAGLLLDEITCMYGENAVTLIAPEIEKRMANFQNVQKTDFSWMSLEASLLALGAIAEGARVCFPNDTLLNLAIGALNVAKRTVESHILAQNMSFWCLSKYAPHLLETVTDPERGNSTCETLLIEVLTTSLSTMRETESKLIQDAASSCLLAYLQNLPPPSESVKSIFSLIPAFMNAMVETFAFCWGRFQLKNKCHLFAIINELCQYDTHAASLRFGEEKGQPDGKEGNGCLEISLSKIAPYIPEIVNQLNAMIAEIASTGFSDESFPLALRPELKSLLPYLLTTCSYLMPYLLDHHTEQALRLIGANWVAFAANLFIVTGKRKIRCKQQHEDTDEGIDDNLLASTYVLIAAVTNEQGLNTIIDPLFFGSQSASVSFATLSEVLVQLVYGDDSREVLRRDTICEFSLRLLDDIVQSYNEYRSNAAAVLSAEFKASFHLFTQLERRMCGGSQARLAPSHGMSLLRVTLVLGSQVLPIFNSIENEDFHAFYQLLSVLRSVAQVSSLGDAVTSYQTQRVVENLFGVIRHEKANRKVKGHCALCVAAFSRFHSSALADIDAASVHEIIRLMLSHAQHQSEVTGLLQLIMDLTQHQARSRHPTIGDFFMCPEFFDLLLSTARTPNEKIREISRCILRIVSDDKFIPDGFDVQSIGAIRKNYQEFIVRFRQGKGLNYCRTLFEKLSESYGVSLL